MYYDAARVGAINGPLTAGTELALPNETKNTIFGASTSISSITGLNSDITTYVGTSPTDNGAAGTAMQELNGAGFRGGLTGFSSGDVILDIFQNSVSGTVAHPTVDGWTFDGSLVINLTGTPSIQWDPAGSGAVPEPAAYGMLAGAGLLVVALRRQFRGARA